MQKTNDDAFRKGQLKEKMMEAAIKAELRGGGLVNLPAEKAPVVKPAEPSNDIAPA